MPFHRLLPALLLAFLVLTGCNSTTSSTTETTTPPPEEEQISSLPPNRLEQLKGFIQLLDHREVEGLADMVKYPYFQKSPIPNINNAAQMVRAWQYLMDDSLSNALLSMPLDTPYAKVDWDGDWMRLLGGEVLMDSLGQLVYIRPETDAKKILQEQLQKKVQLNMHPSVAEWKENYVSIQSGKFQIRVDALQDGSLRYSSWNKPKTMADPPDLVLENGEENNQGRLSFIFENGAWTYELVDQSGSYPDLWILNLKKSGKEVSNYYLIPWEPFPFLFWQPSTNVKENEVILAAKTYLHWLSYNAEEWYALHDDCVTTINEYHALNVEGLEQYLKWLKRSNFFSSAHIAAQKELWETECNEEYLRLKEKGLKADGIPFCTWEAYLYTAGQEHALTWNTVHNSFEFSVEMLSDTRARAYFSGNRYFEMVLEDGLWKVNSYLYDLESD